MKKYVLLLPFLLGLACQPEQVIAPDLNPGNGLYNDAASIRKKIYCNSAACDKPGRVESYEYNRAGQLTKINHLGQIASGNLELSSYVEQTYNQDGQLVRKILYGKYGANAVWTPYDEWEYNYVDGALQTERHYFNQKNPDLKVLIGQIDYVFEEGRKIEEKRYDTQKKLLYRVTYTYQKDVLTSESWYDADNKSIRFFEHRFNGSSRQISEYIPSTQERISMVEKLYDSQGRLTSEETKVVNPLLCSMMPGVIRYEY